MTYFFNFCFLKLEYENIEVQSTLYSSVFIYLKGVFKQLPEALFPPLFLVLGSATLHPAHLHVEFY
jgi:hypothetical protein